MKELLIIGAIVFTPWALILLAYLIHRSPVGYQDEKGFHYGEPKH